MNPFHGKKVWLVGASEGIGEELAKQLAASGALVCVSARNAQKLQSLVASLPGAANIALPLDVTQGEAVRKAWEQLSAGWGAPDLVVYNAGSYDPLSVRDFDLEKTERMFDVNFNGALRVLACVIPPMVARKSGHIALVASVAAYSGLPRALGYGASKAALLHLAENARIDLADSGINVQVVSPGFVKTRLTDKNEFKMPFLITADVAAREIMRGLAGNAFDIHFPKRFTCILKCLRLLPYSLYFRIVNLL
jgi:NADP-dependent 3-hydroxy acid dehydrogenase YdfG